MADLRLPDHVRFCEVGDQRIFLDLKGDRYFSLSPGADAAFSAVLRNKVVGNGPDPDPLLDAGVLTSPPAGRAIVATQHPAPTTSLLEAQPVMGRSSLLTVVEVWWHVLRARRRVRTRRLPALLTSAATDQSRWARSSRQGRDRAIADFSRARRMVPFAPNCLTDSLALRAFLKRRSIAIRLVIGVKLHPFAAHCWLQSGSIVLNDTLAAARGFTPILIV